jgi:hypothetical protein
MVILNLLRGNLAPEEKIHKSKKAWFCVLAEGVAVGKVFEDTRVVTNTGPGPLQVWFEPWGMPHVLSPGAPGGPEVTPDRSGTPLSRWPDTRPSTSR